MAKYAPPLNGLPNARRVSFSGAYMAGTWIFLFAVFGMGIIGYNNPASTPIIPDTIYIAILAFTLIPIIALFLYLLKTLNNIKALIINIAIRYGQYNIARTFENDTGLHNSRRENNIHTAYNQLVPLHNEYAKSTYQPRYQERKPQPPQYDPDDTVKNWVSSST